MQIKKWMIGLIVLIIVLMVFFVVSDVLSRKQAFDLAQFNVDQIVKHINELSSPGYEGRQTGSKGNKKALEYIESSFREIGIEPGGVGQSYYQPFSLIVPDIAADSVFSIQTDGMSTAKEFTLYEDYNLLTCMNGGSIDFSGELILVKNKLQKTDPALIKNRVVIIKEKDFTPAHIDYVIKSQGKGIFCYSDTVTGFMQDRYEAEKPLNTNGKTGKAVGAGYISRETYEFLQSFAKSTKVDEADQPIDIIPNAVIKATVAYPVVRTANIVGKIEGKSSGGILLITADIDGSGMGTEGKYFPGAISGASGISVLLEAARVMASQEAVPYKTVVFIGFNGQRQQFSGSSYYIQNPLYPLEHTSVVHLGALGEESQDGLRIYSDRSEGLKLREQIVKHAREAGLGITRAGLMDGAAKHFYEKGREAVTLSDLYQTRDNYEDNIENVNKDSLANASLTLLNYIQKEIYKSAVFHYSSFWDRLVLRFTGILHSGTDTADEVGKNFSVILSSVLKSLILLVAALLISMAAGIASGLHFGYKRKNRSIQSLGSIFALSVPDVLIVLVAWLICIFYAKTFPDLKEAVPIHKYIVPLLTLSILPTIYVSRITLITVKDELKKDYFKNAVAKGFSRKRIVYIELLPAALYKIIDTLPTIMSMLLCNLIVMEYLFNYLGAAYYLLFFFSEQAYYHFAALVAALAVVYLLFTWVVGFAAKLINPLKREVSK